MGITGFGSTGGAEDGRATADRVLLAIPARHASARYPGKPLVPLTGAGGRAATLIRRTWEAAQAVRGIDRVVIATDDARIRAEAEGFGAEVAMTSPACRNGTERCAEALARLGGGYGIVVNLQGDAPLTPPWFVEALVAALRADPAAEVATPVLRADARTLAGLREDRAAGRVGGTTAVFGQGGRALYFSKEVIPFIGSGTGSGTGPGTGRDPAHATDQAPDHATDHATDHAPGDPTPVFHHVGVYAYRPAALAAYPGWPEGPLERLEGLEQLRFLEQGRAVLCVEVEARGRSFWELNNPADVPRIEAMLRAMGIP